MSLGIQTVASHKTWRGSGYGADAREGRSCRSRQRDHRRGAQPPRPNLRVKGCSKEGGEGKEGKNKTPRMRWDCAYWTGSGNGRKEEGQIMSLVKRSGPRASHHPTTRRKATTPRAGLSHTLFPLSLAPTFWLQKLSWQQILSWKFITCLYTKLPESFIATYLTISAFASVIKEINRGWKRVSMEKGPLLWRNNSLGLPETSKCCPASETG